MPKHYQHDTVLLRSAIDMLMKFGEVTHTEDLFRLIKNTNAVTYDAMMKDNLLVWIRILQNSI